ncbi:tyrosine-type recombinase/integrase [Brevibacillus sp. FSL L8-0710]|uniref:tyrosine-type recombinase/integrase n=1 Tax=Brevibacillus sp. FSL L8-0710 TaxID=2975313 RepID=UPI0030F87F87
MDFAIYLRQQEVRDKTIKSYLATVNEYLKWRNGIPDQDELITQLLLLEFKSFLKTVRKNHPKTINKKLAGIRKWLEFLLAVGKIKGAIQVKDEAISELERLKEPKYLDKDEVREIRKAIEKEPNDFLRDRDRCMVYLMLYLGLRQEEVINLQVGDIIRTSGKQKVIIREGKGGFYDELPLDSVELRKALDQWMEQRSNSKFASNSFLFVSRRTEQAGKRAVVKMVERIRKTSGVDFTCHQLRHTFGKRIIDETGNIKKAQELLRHRHTASTEIYTLHRREELVGVLRKLDDVI